MTAVTLTAGPSAPEILSALRAVAGTEGRARAAFDTWTLAQVVGWSEAREMKSSGVWFRHLRDLDAAGIPVPPHLHRAKPAAGTNRPEALTFADVHALVGCGFTVTKAWDPEFYPDGTTGHVFALLFRDRQWLLELALDGSPGGTEHLSIREALHRCRFDKGGPDAG